MICLVVTYGERSTLVAETLDRLEVAAFSADVGVVLNGASPESARAVRARIPPELIVEIDSNLGSAGGFKAALDFARERGEDVLLLDDDMGFDMGGVDVLEAHADKYREVNGDVPFAIACAQAGNEPEQKVLSGVDPFFAYPVFVRGSIEGFDVLSRFARRHRCVRAKQAPKFVGEAVGGALVAVPIAPYGGLFVSIEALRTGISPREDMFVYCDDYEWTARLVRGGTALMLDKAIRVSESTDSGKRAGVPKGYQRGLVDAPLGSRWRIAYRVRNAGYFYHSIAADRGAELRFWSNCIVKVLYTMALGARSRKFGWALQISRLYIRGARGVLGVSGVSEGV